MPDASVVIVTKDRCEVALRAVESAVRQSPAVEIILIDDASSDGTADTVAAKFPMVRVERSPRSVGCVAQRNRGAALATAPVVVSLDDDATFDDTDVVARTLAELDRPQIAAIRMTRPQAPLTSERRAVASFVGWAYAIRREVFLALGGYRSELVAYGEERDFCIRLLERGMLVCQGTVRALTHRPYPVRNRTRSRRFAQRNDVINAWQNVPFPELIPHVLGASAKAVQIGRREGMVKPRVLGLREGVSECASGTRTREPVSRATYHLFRKLSRPEGLPLEVALEELARISRERSSEVSLVGG
jgi:glycosyltransferase involved in cell wall biosynthesis